MSKIPPTHTPTKIPFQKQCRHAIPRPLQPPPPRALVDCCVVEVGDRAVRSNSPPRSQITTSILPPPPKNSTRIPLDKRSRHAIPRPFQPPTPRTLVDCCVVEVGDRVARSNSLARLQIATSILPPPCRKIRQKSPSKNEVATPSPGRFSPNPVVLRLIVMLSAIATGRIVRFRPPGRKMKAIPPPPRQQILSIFPLERRATAPSPGRLSPHPGAHWFIVMFLRLGTGRSDQIRPPSRNLTMP